MMKLKFKKTYILLFGFGFLMLLLPVTLQMSGELKYGIHNENEYSVLTSAADIDAKLYTKDWITNNNFATTSSWYSTFDDGDSSDMSTIIASNAGNFIVNGEDIVYNDISGVPISTDWTAVNNTAILLEPDSYEIDDFGCKVVHDWLDPNDPGQLTSIHWDRNISLGVDMSDYNITSVSLSAIVNASAEATGTWGIESKYEGTTDPGRPRAGDYVRFYVLISDIYKNEQNEVSHYLTSEEDLGNDTNVITEISHTLMHNLDEEVILYHMKSVLNADPAHSTFTLTLGMYIVCEDDFSMDHDRFNYLRINQCNFSFTYERLIDQTTSMSWRQDGPTFSSVKFNATNNISIVSANLNFEFKISEIWPANIAPNAEIRFSVNDYMHDEVIYLEEATTSWQSARFGMGYDVTNLISVGSNFVNFSIQLYMGDEFSLSDVISFSITNIHLRITYWEYGYIPNPEPPYDWTPWILFLTLAICAAVAGLLSYVFYFKYPLLVRRIKSLRRKIRKNKSLSSPVLVKSRDNINKHLLNEKKKLLNVSTSIKK
ncbi:MAG: LapA family protein [Promethearchaeota archaeon]